MAAKQGVLPLKDDAAGTVTSVSVATANGFAGAVANPTSTPQITMSVTFSGLAKGNGTALSAAVSGTDYAPATSGSSILYGNGAGGFSNVTVGSGLSFAGGTLSASGGTGTVTNFSFTNANGFTGSVTNPTTTPTLSVGTSITGLLKGNGTAISAATSGTDYAPATTGSSVLKASAGGFANATTADIVALLGTLTANNVLLGNGTGNLQVVAPGSPGNVLTSDGTTWASAAPAGASALVLLSTATASSSETIDFTSSIDSTYQEYQIHFENLVPATNAALLMFRTSSDGGSTWASSASDYSYANIAPGSGGTSANAGDAAADKIIMTDTTDGVSNTTSHGGISGILTVYDPAQTTGNKDVAFQTTYHVNASALRSCLGGGSRRTTSAVNGFRLLFSTGAVASGFIKLYGVKK